MESGFKTFLKRRLLLIGGLAAILPLLAVFFLQYRTLKTLGRTLPAYRKSLMTQHLREVAEKVYDYYAANAKRVSGLDVCKQLRAAGAALPVIMLTARGQELDKVIGLRSGADDYVTKPFSLIELLARIEAVLRRAAKRPESFDSYRFGDVSLDFKKHEIPDRAPRRDRHARPTARQCLVLRQLPDDAHRGYAHRQTSPED